MSYPRKIKIALNMFPEANGQACGMTGCKALVTFWCELSQEYVCYQHGCLQLREEWEVNLTKGPKKPVIIEGYIKKDSFLDILDDPWDNYTEGCRGCDDLESGKCLDDNCDKPNCCFCGRKLR